MKKIKYIVMFKNFFIFINFIEGFVNYNCECVKYNSINM